MLSTLFSMPVLVLSVCEFCAAFGLRPVWEKWSVRRITFTVVMAAALTAAVGAIDLAIVDTSNASTAIEAPMCLIASLIFCFAVLKFPGLQAVYTAFWAYLLAELIVQLYFVMLSLLPDMMPLFWKTMAKSSLATAAAWGLYLFSRLFLSRELQEEGGYPMNRSKILFSAVVVVLFMGLSNYQFVFWLMGVQSARLADMISFYRVLAAVLCIVMLYLQNNMEKRQRVQQDLAVVRQLWHHQQEQYRISSENIELINRKCHDLKYQIASLRTEQDGQVLDSRIREVERSVMIYDSVVRTGNPVLDVVLTEKSLYCEAHHISMTCMADARQLDFLESGDLYSLFGNALDNAVESVMKQEEEEKRVIQVSVFPEKNLLMIRVRNYCDEEIRLVDGLPVTSKTESPGYHGYGMKSIRYTAEKYGGGMSVEVKNHTFSLQVLIPLPGPQ